MPTIIFHWRQKKMNFNKNSFTQENLKILNNFKKCIESRSLEKMSKALYEFLHLYAGFIAHYSYTGFQCEYEGRKFLNFIKHYEYPIYPIRNDSEAYRQINEMNQIMKQYIQSEKEQIIFEFNNHLTQKKVEHLKLLANELGYDIVPQQQNAEGSIDLNTVTQPDGQISLF